MKRGRLHRSNPASSNEDAPDLGDPAVVHREFFRNSLICHHCGYTNYAHWKIVMKTKSDVIKPRRKCAKCGRQLHPMRDRNYLGSSNRDDSNT